MTRDEMLKKMGLTEHQHGDLMKKFETFYHSLDKEQKKVVDNTMPSAEQAAKSFGPSTTVEDLKRLSGSGVVTFVCSAFAGGGGTP